MNNKTHKRKNTEQLKYSNSSNQISKLYIIPIIITLCILPFIVGYSEIKTLLNSFRWFPDVEQTSDFFMYYKEMIFLMISFIIACFLSFIIYKKGFKIEKFMLPLIVYISLMIVSTLFSKNFKLGYSIHYSQFESIFVHMGYVFIILYCFYFIKDELQYKKILNFFIFSIFLMSLMGALQTLGFDYFNTSFGMRSILPSNMKDSVEAVKFKFPAKTAYMTLYNPNYAGVYIAMVLPFTISILFTIKDKKTTIIAGITNILLIVALYGTKSEAAIISIGCVSVLLLIFLRKSLLKKRWLSISILSLMLVGLILKGESVIATIKPAIEGLTSVTKTNNNLKSIETDDSITINYKDNIMNVSYTYDNEVIDLVITDEKNNIVETEINGDRNLYIIKDERFSDIVIIPGIFEDMFAINIKIDQKDWLFTNETEDGTYYYINNYGKLDKIISPESWLFDNYESFASGRGYIWSRSLPLLKENIIIGSGAQTYPIVFPQQDYVGLYNNGFSDSILTKPHSLYLQIGIQAGVLSLIAFIIFYAMYFLSSIKLYFNGIYDSVKEQMGVSIFFGTVSYMIMGLANDSTIMVSPIYWTMMGLGITLNYLIKAERNSQLKVDKK